MEKQLTEDQAQQFLNTLQGHDLEAIITLALFTGMRRNELLVLRWQDIDLEKQELRVPQTKDKDVHQILHLSNAVVDMLNQHHLHVMKMQEDVGSAWQNHDLVFPDATGGKLNPQAFLKAFHEIAKQAALPHLHFHDLRTAVLWNRFAQLRTGKQGNDEA